MARLDMKLPSKPCPDCGRPVEVVSGFVRCGDCAWKVHQKKKALKVSEAPEREGEDG